MQPDNTPKCDKHLELLRHLCSGNSNPEAAYQWVLKWLALPLQYHGAKMSTPLLVSGPQASGKTLFFRAISRIYGGEWSVSADADIRIFDRRENSLLLVDDVIVSNGEPEISDDIIDTIIFTDVQILDKHQKPRNVKNSCNVVLFTNSDGTVVLDKRIGDNISTINAAGRIPQALADAVCAELDTGAEIALKNYLLNLDLGNFTTITPMPA